MGTSRPDLEGDVGSASNALSTSRQMQSARCSCAHDAQCRREAPLKPTDGEHGADEPVLDAPSLSMGTQTMRHPHLRMMHHTYPWLVLLPRRREKGIGQEMMMITRHRTTPATRSKLTSTQQLRKDGRQSLTRPMHQTRPWPPATTTSRDLGSAVDAGAAVIESCLRSLR